MDKLINVKMAKDGNRTIIVIEGADPERDRAAYELLNLYFGFDPDGLQKELTNQTEDIDPIPEEPDPIPSDEEIANMQDIRLLYGPNKSQIISNGKYKGLTPAQALEKDREIALVELFNYAKRLAVSSGERNLIVDACKQFMYYLPTMESYYPDRESKINFLSTIDKILTISPFIVGFESLKSFSNFAQDNEINDVFKKATQALQNRATINCSVIR